MVRSLETILVFEVKWWIWMSEEERLMVDHLKIKVCNIDKKAKCSELVHRPWSVACDSDTRSFERNSMEHTTNTQKILFTWVHISSTRTNHRAGSCRTFYLHTSPNSPRWDTIFVWQDQLESLQKKRKELQ